MEQKTCNVCNLEKPVSEFDKRSDNAGYTHWCKPCRRAYALEYIKQPHIKEQRDNYARERCKDPRVKAMNTRNSIKSRDKRRSMDLKNFKLREMMSNARKRAKNKGYDFTITESDFPNYHEIEFCPILGIKLCWENKDKLQHNSPTIDRIDSMRGYTRDNVVIISHRANTLKNDGTAEEHQAIAKFIREGYRWFVPAL